ncbi:calcium-binding protein [Pseudodonghicola xiamenensis]|uniref:Hemolysin-type calcium-binding repeat-containing protein n=1 Tax=Pseudodonghicola xiamenensis TaxID=337702 RepID=A0A8J3H6Y5_9RHOB|nr:hypothetical protein [Pseudodonghicola xiamenensis]GHG92975.1 hypothetical protein GCM10010961_25150 [Pseudodonghicola xiamenensis]
MALQPVTINLTSASSDLQQYLSDWEDGYTADNSGYFYPDGGASYSQWAAGDTSDSSSSAILSGDFTYGAPGGFNGYVDSLTFGNSLDGSSTTGFAQTEELEVVFDNTIEGTDTEFTEAIYVLSNHGTLDDQSAFGMVFSGFNSYFDTYGTTINGTGGADVIEAWAGNDTVFGGAGADYIDGGAGNDILRGQAGQDTLLGGAGDDALYGGAGRDTLDGGVGDDTLTGGNGADTFVFSGTDFGADVVTDFNAGSASSSVDLIELSTEAFADWSAVSAASAQVGSDVVISYDASNSITLLGVTLGDLDTGDFLFV